MESVVMQKFLSLCALFATVGTIDLTLPQPVKAEPSGDYIGPSVTFGDGRAAIGVSARTNILGKNISLRPYWISGGGYGGSLTYDLQSGKPGFGIVPFVGFGWGVNNSKSPNSSGFVHVGLDANLSDNFVLFSSVNFPTNQNFNRSLVVGASLKF
jgi:hypothetical protein